MAPRHQRHQRSRSPAAGGVPRAAALSQQVVDLVLDSPPKDAHAMALGAPPAAAAHEAAAGAGARSPAKRSRAAATPGLCAPSPTRAGAKRRRRNGNGLAEGSCSQPIDVEALPAPPPSAPTSVDCVEIVDLCANDAAPPPRRQHTNAATARNHLVSTQSSPMSFATSLAQLAGLVTSASTYHSHFPTFFGGPVNVHSNAPPPPPPLPADTTARRQNNHNSNARQARNNSNRGNGRRQTHVQPRMTGFPRHAISAALASMRGRMGLSYQDNFTENDYEMLLQLDQNNVKSSAQAGLSASAIDNMPTNVYKAPTGGAPIPSCSVCLEEFKDGKSVVRRLPCLHYYHAKCIDKWLKTSPLCPVCKHNARDGS